MVSRWFLGVIMVLWAGVPVVAQPLGAVESRSSHESDAAQEAREVTHQPRHGGYFGDADDLYHYEVLLDGDQLILYVNDELNRPLDTRPLEATWTLNPDAPEPVTGPFRASPDGAYLVSALPPRAGEILHVKVAVRKGQVWAPMEFYLPAPRTSD